MKTGIELIAQERKEQIEKHGIAIMEDVQNNDYGQLRIAACWMMPASDENYQQGEYHESEIEELLKACPPDWSKELWGYMVNKSTKERLIIAGALIAAELDRMIALENILELNRMHTELDKDGI